MCTLNITLNDSLMDKARPAFADDESLRSWLQKKLSDYANHLVVVSLPNEKQHHRHESLCGILNTKASEEDLLEEYLQDKYNL